MRLKKAALLVPLALFTACPKAPPPIVVPPQVAEARALEPKVHALEEEARALLREQDERVWKSWTQGVPADLAKTYQGKEKLFSPESIAQIHRLRQLSTDSMDERALAHLETYFVGEYLARKTEDLTGAIANLTASLKISYQGKDYPYRDLERLLANEKSAVKRRAIDAAATPAVERLSEMVKRRNDALDAALKDLGTTYPSYGADLRQADLPRLRELASELLDVTQAPYLQVMSRLAHDELGMRLDELHRADLPRLFRPEVVDRYFPKEQLWTRANATAQGLGVDPAAIKGLTLDLEARPHKDPRGLTLPVVIPSDVRVSLVPATGVREQMSFLHELGHALHDTHTREMRFELSKLGDPTVPEAFASLFEELAEDPVWLTQEAQLSGEVLARFLATANGRKLFLVRRAAGRLLFSIDLRTGAAEDPKALYLQVMSRTLGIALGKDDAARALLEEDEFFQSADPLRAWMLAAQLEAQLKARFGPSWWQSRDAGQFLIALWRVGNAPRPEELARTFGDRELEPSVLLLKLGTALGVPLSLPARTAPSTTDAGVPPSDAGTPSADAGLPPGPADAGTDGGR